MPYYRVESYGLVFEAVEARTYDEAEDIVTAKMQGYAQAQSKDNQTIRITKFKEHMRNMERDAKSAMNSNFASNLLGNGAERIARKYCSERADAWVLFQEHEWKGSPENGSVGPVGGPSRCPELIKALDDPEAQTW